MVQLQTAAAGHPNRSKRYSRRFGGLEKLFAVSRAHRQQVTTLVLSEKGVFVIPDILANAGGVTVSYFEWVQDREGFFWNEKLVNSRLEEIMVESFDAVVQYADTHNVNNRIAAYMLALDRVVYAIKLRGIYA